MAVLQFGWEERRRFGDAAAVHSATTRDGLRIDYSRFRRRHAPHDAARGRIVTVSV